MDDLCFCSAAYGGWGIVRVGTLVPESHMLFICPYSCGRHNSIGAEQHGYKGQISYLFIDERDIALGTIQRDIISAVETVLCSLSKRPKVMLLYFSCVLYMSGFDWDAAAGELSDLYSDIRFQPCMMNPIAAAGKKPPALTMHKSLCDLWDATDEHDGGMNLLGCYVPPERGCELYSALSDCGIKNVRHFSWAKSYDEYREMGRSSYNLVLRPEGTLAAKAFSADMDYRFVPVSYELTQIERQYSDVFDMLGRSAEMTPYKSSAVHEIDATLKIVGSRTIAVGNSAVCRPYSLALALLEYGFSVSDVFTDACPPFEKAAYESLLAKYPQVCFHDIHAAENVRRIGSLGNADIAIGYSAGYYTGAASIVDLMTDEGMFGYYGVSRMMRLLRDSVEHPQSLEPMIASYGLIV